MAYDSTIVCFRPRSKTNTSNSKLPNKPVANIHSCEYGLTHGGGGRGGVAHKLTDFELAKKIYCKQQFFIVEYCINLRPSFVIRFIQSLFKTPLPW